MAPKLLVAGIVLSGLAGILLIVSIATTYWATTYIVSDPDIDVHLGLFKLEVSSSGRTVDTDYDTVPGSLMAVRALVIIGLLGEVAGGGLGILVLVLQQNRQSSIKFHLLSLVTFIVANILALIGCVVFRTTAYTDITETIPLSDGTLSFSFFMAVIGCVVGSISGSLIFRGGKMLMSQEYSVVP